MVASAFTPWPSAYAETYTFLDLYRMPQDAWRVAIEGLVLLMTGWAS